MKQASFVFLLTASLISHAQQQSNVDSLRKHYFSMLQKTSNDFSGYYYPNLTQIYSLSEKQFRVLWTDLSFPHLFCAIAHKYYLGQKRSWSDEKYIWALQNIIALEDSKEEFLQSFSSVLLLRKFNFKT